MAGLATHFGLWGLFAMTLTRRVVSIKDSIDYIGYCPVNKEKSPQKSCFLALRAGKLWGTISINGEAA
jgi:hypothetical protein